VTQPGSTLKPSGTIHGRVNGKRFRVKVRNGVAHAKVKVRKHHRAKVKLTFTSPNYKKKTKTIKVKG